MHIIITGCGRIGCQLIKDLIDDGHDIVIIDRDKEKLDSLGSGLNATRILGIEYDIDILKEAGIEYADMFLGLTPNDSVNITACQVARDIFKVKKVIGKVADINKEHIYISSKIEYINPIKLGIEELKDRIRD